MKKEPKTLPQAIKIIVGIYGKNVVNDVQMVNIMNDVVSLEDPAAIKSILRDVIKMGYGRKMLAINVPQEDYSLKVKAYSKDISDSLGYKEVMVQYILYSVAYGIGICPSEPYLKNIVKTEKKATQASIIESGKNEGKMSPSKAFAVCVVVLIVAGVLGFGYRNSSTEREEFEKKLFTGNSLMSSGDYSKAIVVWGEAYNNYNAIGSGSYKEEALRKIEGMIAKLVKEGESDNKTLYLANSALETVLQFNLKDADKERLKIKKEEVEKTISFRVENGRNTLITTLSANNGKLDEGGNQLLESLLELAPNDYWLNFIKKKNNE